MTNFELLNNNYPFTDCITGERQILGGARVAVYCGSNTKYTTPKNFNRAAFGAPIENKRRDSALNGGTTVYTVVVAVLCDGYNAARAFSIGARFRGFYTTEGAEINGKIAVWISFKGYSRSGGNALNGILKGEETFGKPLLNGAAVDDLNALNRAIKRLTAAHTDKGGKLCDNFSRTAETVKPRQSGIITDGLASNIKQPEKEIKKELQPA